jgi:hypothetical protein
LSSYRKTAKDVFPHRLRGQHYQSCRFESRDRCHLLLFENAFIFWGLRRIEWVILRLKTRQSWGLQGAFAFLRDLKFGTTDGWHEHRNVHGGFGIRIRFLVFDRNRQCAESLVIRKHA